ncbi:MAG: YciI family protein [Pseudomonadota bacterium]
MLFVIQTTTVGDRKSYQEHLEAHTGFLRSLTKRGLLLAGTFDDHTGGMILLKVEDLEEAVAIAQEDPMVKAGVDRYQVRALELTVDSLNIFSETTTVRPQSKSSPLKNPTTENNFTVVDAFSDPKYSDFLTTCFAPRQIPIDDPTRQDYLRLARDRGLHKLILLHENTLAGQIEFAPPGVAGLPISGEGVTVIHCLWVKDAYTGLDGGRHLLSTCAETSNGTKSLATVAYNSTLGWLPKSFFRRQGFVIVDQIETGRFFGDTPIVAYLLWRPLQDNAPKPTWNREALLSGIDFCPAYPWMFGQRRYWGRDYVYRAVLVREGLRRPELINQFPVLGSQRTPTWTLVKVGIPAADLNRAISRIQAALIEEPAYYSYIYAQNDSSKLIIIFPRRKFEVTGDIESWSEAIRYGISKGIPREELVFTPFPFEDE